MNHRLLSPDEPSPVFEHRREGRSSFVIAVDHASRRIPKSLDNLGLPDSELGRHIAWDIGALEVGMRISNALDAPLIAQNYSRLVIDCNRDPRLAASIPTISELIEIPGNIGLSDSQVASRRLEIFDPYHEHLEELLDARASSGRRTILVALHSMTNVYKGVRREMHGAVLYNRDRRFAGLVLEFLRRETGLIVGDNEPYFGSDETDYTIPRHGEGRGLPHAEIEMRQDLILNEAGQAQWAKRLSDALQTAERTFLEMFAS